MRNELPPEAVAALATIRNDWGMAASANTLEHIIAKQGAALERVLEKLQTRHRENARQAEALERAQQEIERLEAIDTCMCGSPMNDHSIGSGHSPVSMYEYHHDQQQAELDRANSKRDRLAEALEESSHLYEQAATEPCWCGTPDESECPHCNTATRAQGVVNSALAAIDTEAHARQADILEDLKDWARHCANEATLIHPSTLITRIDNAIDPENNNNV